ncbi:MAG TPA: prolipoprotein diacylglyceryl transferase [Allosphingosinicella sp.]|nr:prolipoprotein diacylglyceryl transferase [Allosphingosinicella sp.]
MIAADVSQAIHYNDLGLDPIIFEYKGFALRWYSLAYLAGILIGWWYLLKLIDRPGAPMARRHADDMVFYATLGIILGGRLGYVLFYKPAYYFSEPLQILRLWDGGMSFHGGVIGTSLGIFYLARKNGLNWLRIHDYVACVVPFGLFFGRLANFVNHELWGRETDAPWGVIFPDAGPFPRHPSQLYEAGLEGIVLFLILWFLFWRTDSRYYPGRLVGTFLLGYGVSRFIVEFWREPDQHLIPFAHATGLHMGQWLSIPMILAGAWFIATSKKRRQRVEPIAGGESVA